MKNVQVLELPCGHAYHQHCLLSAICEYNSYCCFECDKPLKQYINNRDEITPEVKNELPSFTNLEEIFGIDDAKKSKQETDPINKRVKIDNIFGDLG